MLKFSIFASSRATAVSAFFCFFFCLMRANSAMASAFEIAAATLDARLRALFSTLRALFSTLFCFFLCLMAASSAKACAFEMSMIFPPCDATGFTHLLVHLSGSGAGGAGGASDESRSVL
ncbi:hypothetical protein HDK90DRAFT_493139 [Phyllosticta capitalensis]|uniref:Secreted protein n=1 Tax=Phyllosticta capitalensis TaxID=121624 RepID=A0ABR1YGF8_9PEZI